MAITTDELYQKFTALSRRMTALENSQDGLIDKFAVYMTKAEMETMQLNFVNSINQIIDSVANIDAKLSKISLPNETRYYLSEAEISDFRRNIRQLKAMMADLEKMKESIVALNNRYNLSNRVL